MGFYLTLNMLHIVICHEKWENLSSLGKLQQKPVAMAEIASCIDFKIATLNYKTV